MRKCGTSMTVIEKKLGIPRSTLSLWFKNIELSDEYKLQLAQNKADGWAKARIRAAESHRAKKALRLLNAKKEASLVVNKLEPTKEVLDLALAMLYWGEGAKNDKTSIANSDPNVLRFILKVLMLNYGLSAADVRCELHLRMDQDANELKQYWANELMLPLTCFGYIAFDKRTEGKTTYDHYKGVCVINCGGIAIQRKLMYLYTLFCDKVSQLDNRGD